MISALLLTSCGTSTPKSVGGGSVISCSTIPTDATKTSGTTLECLDGNSKVLLESIKGPALINVWGSWCTTCLDEMPEFVSFYSKAKGKVQLVGIAVEEASPANSQRFIEENGMTWPNYYDRENETRAYFGMGVPVTLFIDADGKTVYKKIGVIESESEIIALTEKYLGVKI